MSDEAFTVFAVLALLFAGTAVAWAYKDSQASRAAYCHEVIGAAHTAHDSSLVMAITRCR